MNARLRLSTACAAALLTAAAQAQTHVRPGLWEEQITLKTDNAQANAAMAQMKDKLASMPPEQRAAIEKMMAGHGHGIGAGGAPNTVRTCITKEQVERGFHARRQRPLPAHQRRPFGQRRQVRFHLHLGPQRRERPWRVHADERLGLRHDLRGRHGDEDPRPCTRRPTLPASSFPATAAT